MPQDAVDRRIERTRRALVGAFNGLVLEGRRYDRITVADLIARAGVGRSTFYEHYRNKDEVLAEAIRAPFEPLAASVETGVRVPALCEILRHFHENRVHAKVIFAGSARRKISRVLARMLADRLRARAKANGATLPASAGIAAIELADGQLGTIAAWLAGEIAGDADRLAHALSRTAQAVARDLCAG
ncbi:MAG TPA: helix-turn-helix domain-containing protein [Rhodanobacteraceae bacterium]|nr:helix-turn-helix domain-containing protein [Rhodanobacteraceae bacterium]